jgi:adenosylmethionine-8-amino-7-oxononanoate aminotransferase
MIELAEALLKIAPKGLDKVLFANSSSDDQAAKIAGSTTTRSAVRARRRSSAACAPITALPYFPEA